MGRTKLAVSGMSCTGCKSKVEEAVSAIEGVTSVSADHEADSLTVTFEGSPDQAALAAAVAEAGYQLDH